VVRGTVPEELSVCGCVLFFWIREAGRWRAAGGARLSWHTIAGNAATL